MKDTYYQLIAFSALMFAISSEPRKGKDAVLLRVVGGVYWVAAIVVLVAGIFS